MKVNREWKENDVQSIWVAIQFEYAGAFYHQENYKTSTKQFEWTSLKPWKYCCQYRWFSWCPNKFPINEIGFSAFEGTLKTIFLLYCQFCLLYFFVLMEQAKTEREREGLNAYKTNRGWLMLGALEESELMKSLERKFTS